MKKQGFKKIKRLLNLFDNLKCSNIWIIGVPEGEQQQEIENLFAQIMNKENFPNLCLLYTSDAADERK